VVAPKEIALVSAISLRIGPNAVLFSAAGLAVPARGA
jgi:hypothetical protein